MKDGGTGRRGEMNLSLQKASETGLRGTDGEEVGVSERLLRRRMQTSQSARRVKKREGLSVVTALTQTLPNDSIYSSSS